MSGEREGAGEEGDQDDLSPVGAGAARNALLELALGVLTRQADGNEPRLAPALVQAAKDLVRG
ncbi:hypothetical protein [Streptomyces sp. NPDC001642]|uniref:hypothetical protein n=1 Tax=Streptomyces sp. NPDC001642 TaxID=3154392 RepID=UPI00332DDAA7